VRIALATAKGACSRLLGANKVSTDLDIPVISKDYSLSDLFRTHAAMLGQHLSEAIQKSSGAMPMQSAPYRFGNFVNAGPIDGNGYKIVKHPCPKTIIIKNWNSAGSTLYVWEGDNMGMQNQATSPFVITCGAGDWIVFPLVSGRMEYTVGGKTPTSNFGFVEVTLTDAILAPGSGVLAV
jgi:hypothetical protein